MVGADIIGKVFHKAVNILRRNLVEAFHSKILRLYAAQRAVFFIKIAEKYPQVVGVGKAGFRGNRLRDTPKKCLRKRRQFLLNFPQTFGFFQLHFFMVCGHFSFLPIPALQRGTLYCAEYFFL